MQVFLDDHEVAVAASSLAEALRAGVAAAQARGRVVVEVKADGVAVGDEQLAQADEPSSARELRLISADPRALVRVTLLDAVDALDEAKRRQDAAAELIQTGETQGALEHLREVISLWQLVQGTLDKSAELLGLKLDTIAINVDGPDKTGRVAEEVEGLKTSLAGVKRTLSQQDWAGLSDVLAYELNTRVERWQRMLRSLADHVQPPR